MHNNNWISQGQNKQLQNMPITIVCVLCNRDSIQLFCVDCIMEYNKQIADSTIIVSSIA